MPVKPKALVNKGYDQPKNKKQLIKNIGRFRAAIAKVWTEAKGLYNRLCTKGLLGFYAVFWKDILKINLREKSITSKQ